MSWKQLHIYTSADYGETVAAYLEQQDALSVTLQDAADQPIYEPELNSTPLWQQTHIVALFNIESNIDHLHKAITTLIPDEQLFNYFTEILDEKNWLQQCQDQFQPMQFGEKLWICPSWSEPPDASAVNIKLDPGLAFGTGTHATTALCLQWLSSLDLKNKTVIDYGCGSGILAIAAIMLGAAQVYAVDIDSQALQATTNNAAQNNISAKQIKTLFPSQLTEQLQVDILIANILANPLIELADTLCNFVKSGGLIGLSGILIEQRADVEQHYQTYVTLDPALVKDDWCLLKGYKK